MLLIAMGGTGRATDSGLACPDWPACYGQWIPPADVHMWFEHSHRLWAGVVGLLVAWLTIWALARHRHRPSLLGLTSLALGLVLVQSGLGAAVVLLQLRADLVTAHLGMSFVIVWCLVVIAVRLRPVSSTDPSAPQRRIGRWAAAGASLVLAQSLLGGQPTGRGAAYVLNQIPVWAAVDDWTGHAREVLHVTHRFGGYLVAAVVVAITVGSRRIAHRGDIAPGLWRLPLLAAGLVVVQVGLGIANVLTQAHVASGIAHLAVASWLFTALVAAAALGLVRPVSEPPPTGGPTATTRPRTHRELPSPSRR